VIGTIKNKDEGMSYTISAYLVDLNQLQQIYGSNDIELVSHIEQIHVEDIANLNTWIEEDWEIEGPKINEVMRANVAGVFPWPYDQAPYKATLELFCKHLGSPLPNDMFVGLSPLGVKFVEEEDLDIGELVFRSSSPVSIPGIEDEDMYRVGCMTYETAAEKLAKRNFISLAELDDDAEWRQQAHTQFSSWLEAAVLSQKGIVTFFN
jgi:hypothetical protein